MNLYTNSDTKYITQMSDLNCINPTEQSVLNRSSKDKFVLILNLPAALRRLSHEDSLFKKVDPLQISIFGAVVPDVVVPPVPVSYGGQVINVSSHSRPNYTPLSVNFVVDNTYTNYYILWKWLALLNDPKESTYSGIDGSSIHSLHEITQLKDYQTNFSVVALNEYNEIITEFKYYNAFITSLKGFSYSYKDPATLESSVEFQYSQFDMERKLLNHDLL